jgi:hypothetical protein
LVDPGYENQLTSLDEILESGIEVGYPDGYDIFFGVSSNLRQKEAFERGKSCSSCELCIDSIRNTGKFAIFAPVWVVQNYTYIINDHSTVCLLNDDDYDFTLITTYVRKGSFLLESLNKYIILSFESGLFDRLAKDIIYMSRYKRNTNEVSNGWFVFTLNHLLIAFYILLFGHGLSFLLFLCEVFFYHFRLRRF